MIYGQLSPAQKRVLKPFVARRVVHDLGAGNLGLARELLMLRAARVVAVDSRMAPRAVEPRIEYVESYFSDFNARVRTAFVSWPYTSPSPDLVRILSKASRVIYLGTNFDGVGCGSQELWAHLRSRQVLAHEPHPHNTLIVYGKQGPSRRLLPEESAAVDVKHMTFFSSAYGAACRA